MMSDKLSLYKAAATPLPSCYRLWPLYGAGLENMGVDGKPIEVDLDSYGPDELLVRHDAVGLCFSDIKIITLGQNHPRIFHDMKEKPVVMGHEVIMTVVGVGENLTGQYEIGQRLTVESDIYIDGVSQAYGYTFQGGLSHYSIIDSKIMNTDHGNMLIPIDSSAGYAETALIEPWACVIAAYRLKYRTAIKSGGTMWVIGTGEQRDYTISAGFDESSHPAKLLLTNIPPQFDGWLRKRAAELGIEVHDLAIDEVPDAETVDDIIMLGVDPDCIEKASPALTQHGVFAVLSDQPASRKTALDVGRIHYNRWLYAGTTQNDISAAYTETPVRSSLKPGGKAWFVGAGGPIGRMHVQRAISFAGAPGVIVCTDVSDSRLEDLCTSYKGEAEAKGIEWVCVNPLQKDTYEKAMAPHFETGFDDIVILAPVPPVISDAASHAAHAVG
jgi:L-sorbose 1-phosphate reductase